MWQVSGHMPSLIPSANDRRSSVLGLLVTILLLTLVSMTAFEIIKELVYPTIDPWQSHFVTILFSGLAAVVAGFLALRKQDQLQQQLTVEIAERTQVEERLRHIQEELEQQVQRRTADLMKANAILQLEVSERKQAEEIARGQTATLTRTLHLLTSTPKVDAVLAHVLTAIAEQLQAFSSALHLYDRENHRAWVEMIYWDGEVSSRPQESDPLLHPPAELMTIDQPIIQRLLRTRSPIIIEDVANTSLMSPELRSWANRFGIKSTLLIPLLLEGNLVGSLHVRHHERRQYRTEEITLAVALAHQAVLALQTMRLAKQGERSAVLTERNRMAREIHDTLSQGFTGIIVQLEAADDVLEETPEDADAVREHIVRARTLARESLAEARRSVLNLRPQILEHASLPAAISHTLNMLTAGTTVRGEFSVTGPLGQLPIEVEEHLLRISQQALTNVVQHAQASSVQVTLAFTAQDVCLVIHDDGRGIDYSKKQDHGFGLVGMQQRAEQIGGRLAITSVLGRGTTLTVTIPPSPQYPVENTHEYTGENQPHPVSDRR